MVSSIVYIVVGWLLWRVVPSWITQGSHKVRSNIRLGLNIVGVVLVLFGIIGIVRAGLTLVG